jgi:hypothetical protein
MDRVRFSGPYGLSVDSAKNCFMDITSRKLLYWKAILLMLCGTLAATGIVIEQPTVKIFALLAVAIWAFARAYYFAFYVIEHHIDSGYRFRGMISLLCYLTSRGRR